MHLPDLGPDLGLTLAASTDHLPLLTTIAAAFAAAWVFGLLARALRLSPIVGYLIGGVLIGKHTPGFAGDPNIAAELAEMGVILLMFGVGLHFHLRDLWAVRRVAFPGAIGQIAMATLASVGLFLAFGWAPQAGILAGIALSVASTVVLLRALTERGTVSSPEGHIAIGWLIVEDLVTVIVLAAVPLLSSPAGVAAPAGGSTLLWAIGKLIAMVAIVLVGGSWIVPRVLRNVARLRSPELFTLTVLVFSVAIAVGAAVFFDASMALGAFLAGMVVAQSPVSHQAGADALPMRDAFGVLFFVSIGMLFDPSFVLREPWLVSAGVAVVLVVKPLAALAIVAILGYSAHTALTVAIGLAQIGEFSFILAGASTKLGLLPESATHVLAATAILSIAVNPLLFALLPRIESALRARPWLWRLVNARHEARVGELTRGTSPPTDAPHAIVVGYGPVGRIVDALLRDAKLETVIVDLNIDTVLQLRAQRRQAIFGDAARASVLREAGVEQASHVVLTLPDPLGRAAMVREIRHLNPHADITVRARYLAELDEVLAAGATSVHLDEGEVGLAMARHVLELRGVNAATLDRMLRALRNLWRLDRGASTQ